MQDFSTYRIHTEAYVIYPTYARFFAMRGSNLPPFQEVVT
jgi:hypothetical protein